MTAPTFTLVPIPFWLSFDLTGKPAGGASLYSWESLDKTQPKAIFQDPAGALPFTNPILFNNNGEAPGPFFFENDTPYFLELYDSSGNLIWDVDGYGPAIAGGGGGGSVTENLFVENLIVNNVFNYNIGSTANPIGATNVVLAPGAHDIYKPDIQFIKNNTAATDQITFQKFTLGSNALTGDITPEYFLQYACTAVGGGGETQKCVQFPICKHVQNLTNEAITFSVWAKGTAGTQTLNFSLYQDFGNGGAPSVGLVTSVQTFTLTGSWTQYVVNTTVPSVTGKTLGTCGNDGLYLQLGFALSQTSTIQFTKPCIYVGTLTSDLSATFDTYDIIDAQTNSPRTGDIRVSLNTFAPFGWVSMNDGSIGSATSGATTRANVDTFQLYNTLWNNVSDTYAPVAGGRGADAPTDFAANKAMTLTAMLGRAIASVGIPSSGGTGNNWALGQPTGAEQHTLTQAELPDPLTAGAFAIGAASGGTSVIENTGTHGSATVSNNGGNQPHNIVQPTTHLNIFIKL